MMELKGFNFCTLQVVQERLFFISLILATIRSLNEIVFALASSGIAVTLWEDGRRAHSALRFKAMKLRPATFRKTPQWLRFCTNVS